MCIRDSVLLGRLLFGGLRLVGAVPRPAAPFAAVSYTHLDVYKRQQQPFRYKYTIANIMLVCLIFKDLLLERAVGMSEVCVELCLLYTSCVPHLKGEPNLEA